MKIFAHRNHVYEDRARHSLLVIPAGGWKEVPDELGIYLVASHPTKLCDVTDEANPDAHTCPITEQMEEERKAYEHRMLEQPPVTTVIKPRLSQQKRELLKKAKKRSRTARMRGQNG